MTLRLYHDWDSVCSFKVRMCLAAKDLEWESTRVDLNRFEHLQPSYLAINPNGVVPTLEHDGFVVPESTVINEYLDEVFERNRLTPRDAKDRATMRVWVKYQDDVLYHAQRPATFQLMVKRKLASLTKAQVDEMVRTHPQPQRARHFIEWATGPVDPNVVDDARQKLNDILLRLERRLADAPWLAGDSFSLAECAYAPFIDRLERLAFEDLWGDKPNAAAWMSKVKKHPAFAKSKSAAAFEMPGPKIPAA
jgi:glutathione S-transferase